MEYYSAIKENIWVNSKEVDEPTKWSDYSSESEVSQKEKNKYNIHTHTYIYIYMYIWNLERWYQWTYLQGNNGDAETENRLWIRAVGEGEGSTNGESRMETHALLYVKWIASGNLLNDSRSSNKCSVTT